jgi:hypothetical protein
MWSGKGKLPLFNQGNSDQGQFAFNYFLHGDHNSKGKGKGYDDHTGKGRGGHRQNLSGKGHGKGKGGSGLVSTLTSNNEMAASNVATAPSLPTPPLPKSKTQEAAEKSKRRRDEDQASQLSEVKKMLECPGGFIAHSPPPLRLASLFSTLPSLLTFSPLIG